MSNDVTATKAAEVLVRKLIGFCRLCRAEVREGSGWTLRVIDNASQLVCGPHCRGRR